MKRHIWQFTFPRPDVILWYVLSLPKMELKCNISDGAMLCVCKQKSFGNTPVFWLLRSNAYTVSRLSLQHSAPSSPKASRLGQTRSSERTQPRELTKTDSRDISYHMTYAQHEKLRERRRERGAFVILTQVQNPSYKLFL